MAQHLVCHRGRLADNQEGAEVHRDSDQARKDNERLPMDKKFWSYIT